jgi:3-methyladenine DNA glycosylase AlkD
MKDMARNERRAAKGKQRKANSEIGIAPAEYVRIIRQRFLSAGDPERAEGQMRYMRHRFAYYGLKAPEWVAILRKLFKEHGMYDGKDLQTFAGLCFREEYHEMFYAGLQMIEKQIRKQPPGFIDFLEKAIIKGDWWDTVDWVNKLVGIHFLRFPEMQYQYCRKWISSDNIWLQRVAILHQLLYREKTDEKLLFEMILRRKNTEEFFVQKGAGWVLREYSKTNPKAVVKFIKAHPDLPKLTVREGMKWLRKVHSPQPAVSRS